MSETLILFDVASRHDTCWSPSAWRTRLALAFKGIRYTTEWVEYPDLAPKFKALGIPPNDPGAFAAYTSPTVRFPDGTYLMDSDKIAKRLEDAHPDPSLHLDSPQTAKAAELARGLLFALIANALPTVVEDILQEPSKSWFVKDREGRFGMTIDEFVQNAGGEVAWRKAEPVMKKLKALLQEGKKHEGPFVLGSVPSYSDMVICATFECLERVAKGEFDRVISYDPSFGELHKACKPWTRKDD